MKTPGKKTEFQTASDSSHFVAQKPIVILTPGSGWTSKATTGSGTSLKHLHGWSGTAASPACIQLQWNQPDGYDPGVTLK